MRRTWRTVSEWASQETVGLARRGQMPGPMGPADRQGHLWARILFSASLLTMWSLPATAQLTLDANLVTTTQKFLAKPTIAVSHDSVIENRKNVSFHCHTNDVNITIHWISNDLPLVIHERVQLSADGKTLTILTVQREDAGTYQCKVQSEVQFQNSDPISLTVNYGPDRVDITRGAASEVVSVVAVEPNTSLTLRCWAESQPAPRYHWTFEHSTAVYPGEQLVIEALAQEHQGAYNCIVLNPLTHLAQSASVLVRVLGPESSLSAGTLAGIAIGILVIIALATGLGYFFYFRNTRRETREEPIHEAVTPNSEKEHPAEPSSNWSQPVYANVPEPQGWDGVHKKELASTSPRGYSHDHRKSSPRLMLSALVPTPLQEDTESTYEVLVNPGCNIYYHIKPSV